MSLSNDFPSRLARVLLAVTLLLAWSGAAQPPALAQTPHAHVAAAPPPDPEALKRLVVLYERIAAVAREELRRPDANPWDWRAKAALLGNDPQRIFEFVRDGIGFEPYEGILRGSEGVMIAGRGNALEQAQLLADMLTAGGHTARLVAAKLPAAQAEQLLQSFVVPDPLSGSVYGERAPGARDDDPQHVESILSRIGLPQELWQPWRTSRAAEQAKKRQAVLEMYQREQQFVLNALSQAGITPGQSASGMKQQLLDKIAARHVWVQRLDPQSNQWIDLDPTFAGTEPGKVLADQPGEPFTPDPSLVHTLTFRLLLQRSSGGDRETVDLLNVPIEAREGALNAMHFSIMPDPATLPGAAQMLEMPPDQAAKKLLEAEKYQAVISVGKKAHPSLMFDRKGETSQPAGKGMAAGVEGVGRRVGGLLGGLGGEEQQKPQSKLVRLWVELRFDGPAGQHVQERVLFDDAPHRPSTFITDWSLFLQGQPLSDAYWSYVATRFTAAVAPVMARAAGGEATVSEGDLVQAYTHALSGSLAYAVMRQAEIGRQLSGLPEAQRPAVLWNQPNLFITTTSLRASGEEAWICSCMDIVRNDLLLLERRGDLKPAAEIALKIGVLDTCLEGVVVEGCPKSQVRQGAASYFAHRRMMGNDAVAVVRAVPAQLQQAAMPDYTRRWIEQSQRPESVAVVPAQWQEAEGNFYFWSVDPATGQAVGRKWDGTGQSMTEYILTIDNAFLAAGLILCGIGGYRGAGQAGNITSTVCCIGASIAGRIFVSSLFINSLLFSHALHSAVIPQIDPCYWAGQATGI